MKISLRNTTALAVISLCQPAAADTIYSNLQDIAIPTDFTGVSVTVNGGTINPFFGGVGVANDNLFQPVRDGTGNLDTIQNLAVGSLINAGQLFSTSSGGSQDHLGTTFSAGQEGFIGFKTGAGNYGWMRVVFTGNTAGAVIKDWAYDNSGAAINVGRIQQGAAIGNAQLVTLSPGSGESFTLGSAITDTGDNVNSVLVTGGGTTTLSNASYTGTTTIDDGRLVLADTTSFAGSSAEINGGTLELNRTGSNWSVATVMTGSGTIEKSGTGQVTLAGASGSFAGTTTISNGILSVNGALGSAASSVVVNANGKLGGSGTVGGSVTVNANGSLAAGNGAGVLTTGDATLASGSIFEWDLNDNLDGDTADGGDTGVRGTNYDGFTASNLTVASDAIFGVILTDSATFADDFWNTNQSWTDIFNISGTTSWANGTSLFETVHVYSGGSPLVPVNGSFSFTGSTLTWSAVPEPTSALAGLLIGAGLLRRRRG